MSEEIQTTCEGIAARYLELVRELDLAIESGDEAKAEAINSESNELWATAANEMKLAGALEIRLMLLGFKASDASNQQRKKGVAR
jgi:hypothetical protein